jgi:adenosine deaminase
VPFWLLSPESCLSAGTSPAGQDRSAPLDTVDAIDAADTVDAIDAADTVDAIDAADTVDAIDAADAVDAVDAPPVPIEDGVPVIGDLPTLLAYLDWSCSRIDRADQLELIAYEITRRARASGTGHVDVIFNPTHWPHWSARGRAHQSGRLGEMIDALDAGFSAGEDDHDVTADLCVSLKRTQTRAEALQLVDYIVAIDRPRVVALSIDGNEDEGTRSHNDRFAPAFERARRAGLRTCAHAGESSGAAGVRAAVEILGAERIDHGIRAIEDPEVVRLLADRRIPLDVCPMSNVTLGIVPSLAEHPIDALLSAGVPCSVNTDDPLLYGIDLAGEYTRTARAFGWGTDELERVARVGIESCFATEERKADLLRQLDEYVG